MPPFLHRYKMENTNQSVSHQPQFSSQGYSHQISSVMWSGNKACQNAPGQIPNADSYPQQMNRYYQGHYASQPNAQDMNRYMSSVSKNQNPNSLSYNHPQYPNIKQNSYPCTNPPQNVYHHASQKSNCNNVCYGNTNSSNSYPTSNVIHSPKKYANSSLGLSQAPQCVPQNSQPLNSAGVHMPHMPHHYGDHQNAYNMQNAYINNYAMHQNAEAQQSYAAARQQHLSSPSTVMPSQEVQSIHQANLASTNQVSSIPTPPESSSLPSESSQSTDNTSPEASTDSTKMSISSPSFVLPGSTVNNMPTSMASSMSSNANNNNIAMNMRNANNMLQPPANLDEGSQASSASASSSIPDDQNSTKTNSKPNFSYPPTPNTLSSPGAASMSSFHDDLECISSPGWPKTPASPVANSNYEFANIKRPENLMKLYTLSDEAERRYFLDKLIVFNEDRGSPITQCPTISKQPLDVFRVYLTVKERGGFVEVTNAKRWKDIAGAIGVGASSSAAYTLRKQYMKLLLPFECKFDRGGIDPQPIINMVEASSRKKAKSSTNNGYANTNHYNQGYPMERYHSGYPGTYQPSRYHCSSRPMDYQCSSNVMHYPQSATVAAAAATAHPSSSSHHAMQSQNQYNQYTHNSQANYGYYQGNCSTSTPMYNNNMQTNNVCRYGNTTTSSPVPQEQGYYLSHSYVPPHQNQGSQENAFAAASSKNCKPSAPEADQQQQHVSQTSSSAASASNPATVMPSENSTPPQPKTLNDNYAIANVNNVSVSNTCTDSTQDSNLCYSSNYEANSNALPSNQNPMVAKESTPVVNVSQSYQQIPVNSSTTKAPGENYVSNTSVPSHQMTNYPQNSYQNHKLTYQGAYHSNERILSNQYNHHIQTQNETYQGSEGPPTPTFQEEENRCTSTPINDTSANTAKPYQYNNIPPKPKEETYSPSQNINKDLYNNPPYATQFNNRPPRRWLPEQNQYSYQVPAMQHAPQEIQVKQQDFKPSVPGPRLQKPWLNRDAIQNQNKMQQVPAPMSMQNLPQNKPQVKSEFPPGSVESVRPVAAKRRRCPAKRLDPIDPWRLMMALKSGLLAESTWAFDILSILLCDSTTVAYLGLGHLPGLLGVIVDQYRYFLNEIFHLAEDLEPEWKDNNRKGSGVSSGAKWRLLEGVNYTYHTRCHKKVRIQYDEALFLLDNAWDKHEGFDVSQDHWVKGGGDVTFHVQNVPREVSGRLQFARRMKGPKIESDRPRVKVKPFAPARPGEPVVVLEKIDKEIEDLFQNRQNKRIPSPPADRLRGSESSRKRFLIERLEEEAHNPDEAPLCPTEDDWQDNICRRCACISTVIRNLSFVPGNDLEMRRCPGLLLLLGRLLLLHHEHRQAGIRPQDSEASPPREWWRGTLSVLRDNALVTLSNIAGRLDLSPLAEEVSFPILDGLLHWAVCPSSCARDPPGLSPRRLSLESLCKLSVLSGNVDLMVATPPWSRIESLFNQLCECLGSGQEQVLREFAVVLLSNVSAADASAARTIAEQPRCISRLLSFLEEAETNAFRVASEQGAKRLKDRPELMGTTPDVALRAAATLRNLASVPENRCHFVQHQSRLLALATSQVVEQGLAAVVADVLFYCSADVACPLPTS